MMSRDDARQAVIEVVAKGYRPPRRRTPKHKREPNPAFDRFLSVEDACRELANILGEHDAETILAGALDDASRERACLIFRTGYERLSKFMQHLDARDRPT